MNKNAKFIVIALISILVIVITSASRNKDLTDINNDQNNLQPKELHANLSDAIEQENVRKRNNEVIKVKQILQESISDVAIGQVGSPVTIIEYASLSCSHCAPFSNRVFGRLQEEYIDTGKVRFIFRHFPLNYPAFAASAATLCSYKELQSDNSQEDEKKYYNLIKALFKTQDSWAFSKQFPSQLKQILRLNGLSSSNFDKCLKNKDLENAILQQRMDASKYLKVGSTPTFFINGKPMIGSPSYKKIKNAIDKALNN